MTKEEILEKSREENSFMDEREKEIQVKAGDLAGGVSLILAFLMVMVNTIANGPDYLTDAIVALAFCYFAVDEGVKARYLKKKSSLVSCVGETVCCIYYTLNFIFGVLG